MRQPYAEDLVFIPSRCTQILYILLRTSVKYEVRSVIQVLYHLQLWTKRLFNNIRLFGKRPRLDSAAFASAQLSALEHSFLVTTVGQLRESHQFLRYSALAITS